MAQPIIEMATATKSDLPRRVASNLESMQTSTTSRGHPRAVGFISSTDGTARKKAQIWLLPPLPHVVSSLQRGCRYCGVLVVRVPRASSYLSKDSTSSASFGSPERCFANRDPAVYRT